MDVGLRQMRYFVAVAEELSFTKAAERLHMAQPPLSVQIRKVEAELGVELFDRSKRSISLTPAGTALLAEARRLLDNAEIALRAVRQASQGQVGSLTIGFVPSASNVVLPSHLRAFRATLPLVELYLRELPPDQLVAALHSGAVDVGYLYLPFSDPALSIRSVRTEPLVAAVATDHPLAGQTSIGPEELAAEPFILPARHSMPGLLAQVLAACRSAGFEPAPVQKDVWLMQTVTALIAAGIGVALLPESSSDLARPGVSFIRLAGDATLVETGMCWRRENASVPLQRYLEATAGD
ncbi:MAG: LysR substrate-binding domain-containing protein [Baekduia sp.]